MSARLRSLLNKDSDWFWGPQQETAFEKDHSQLRQMPGELNPRYRPSSPPAARASCCSCLEGDREGPSSRLSDVTDQEELSAVAAPPLSIKRLLTPDPPGYAATQRRNQTPSCFVIDIGHHHRLLPVRRAALAWKVIGKGHRLGCLTSQTKKSWVLSQRHRSA
ncbi:hypothetical protein MRX96_051334 [Rhipicephalus microplus]